MELETFKEKLKYKEENLFAREKTWSQGSVNKKCGLKEESIAVRMGKFGFVIYRALY